MKDIREIYEEVFIYLESWSEQSRTNGELNPYFYMRSVRDDRFQKGYWFPGNDSYMCLSFWSGGDSLNKTPNIFFEINITRGCSIVIVSRDSDSKTEYFKKMIEIIDARSDYKYIPNKKNNSWRKNLSRTANLWQNDLNFFLDNEKRRIDDYLLEHPLTELEEFISNFDFISSQNFDAMYSRVLQERAVLEEKANSLNKSFQINNKLPVAIQGFRIENFQGMKISEIDQLPTNAQWIFITGENGYGKTTLLQAIALGLCSDPDLEKYLDNQSRITVKLSILGDMAFPVRTKGNLSNSGLDNYGEFVVGYGPVRLNIQSKSSENMETKSQNHVMSLFENETLLKNINYELFASRYSNEKVFLELSHLITTVTDGRISKIIIDERQALFIETLSNGDRLEPLPLSKLAAGFRSIINIVFDIYLRFKKTHPNEKYSDFFGIVLIDEIENHLHPILQRELPIALSKVFPNIQFIISTHSPIPLLGANKNSLILRVNRSKEEGVTVERLDEIIDFPTLLPNTILTSPIFGFQEIFSESKDNNDFVRVENTYDEVLENNDQMKRIRQHFDPETTDEILKLLK